MTAFEESPTHVVSLATERVDLMKGAWMLEDPTGELSAAQVAELAANGGMKRISDLKIPVLRTVADYTAWLKFDVATDSSAPQDWLLVVGGPVIDHVQLFTRTEGGQWTGSPVVGVAEPFSARPIHDRNFVFPVLLHPRVAKTLLLRIRDRGDPGISVRLWQPAALQASDRVASALLCLYFGLVLGMILYNLLLYAVVKDRRFILYVGFITCLGLALAGNTGLGAQYVWGERTWWSSRVSPLGYSGALLFSTALTRLFFSTRERLPIADTALRVMGWVAIISIAAVILLPKYIASALILPGGAITATLTAAVSILAVFRRWPAAAYFCAGSLAIHISAVVASTRHIFLVPRNITTAEAFAIGSALEMILLSLALADRINEERRLKQRAQSQTLGILQASLALSSETRLQRLHERIGEVMGRVTGATATHLVLWDADLARWFLYWSDGESARLPVEDAGARGLIPISAFRHVQLVQSPLVLDDALADPRFAPDPAFARTESCSLLVLPISQPGDSRAMLLLEARNMRGAFSDVVLGAVEAIAGPLAVYLENALLYERLEQRVAQQMRELRETQQELVETARRAGMAEVAANVLHNVGNTLNSVNVAAELMRTRISQSCGSGLARAVDLLDARAHDIGRFIEHDQKGRMLPAYLRELADALSEERGEMIGHLDRLVASVAHIKNVIATQQAYAGRGVLSEPVRPAELVDEALRIADDALQEAQVTVVKQLDDVPALRLDRTRTVQILVNLMTNAKQAMEKNVAQQAAMLTLRMITDDGKLRIEVRDCGIGIAPEHLGKLFSHGFTTRPDGHGFGLHSCALAASEMGGRLTAYSGGSGLGATFTLELPLVPA
jgi:C4-dicarboxylate-specific signal transduction histidine kinase